VEKKPPAQPREMETEPENRGGGVSVGVARSLGAGGQESVQGAGGGGGRRRHLALGAALRGGPGPARWVRAGRTGMLWVM